MKLSQFKSLLETSNELRFKLPDGTPIPAHFHITEAGLTTKQFVDCGGTVRTEKKIHLQVWVAGDTEHRLSPPKLMKILQIAEGELNFGDMDIEIEYQTATIGRYDIAAASGIFDLKPIQTNCLAKDHCGIPNEKIKIDLSEINEKTSCCSPAAGCC